MTSPCPAEPTRWLHIVGIGEDGVEGLCPAARALIGAATLVVGGARHLARAAPLIEGETLAWPSPISDAYPAILARRGRAVVVLGSGDPMWFGIGGTLARQVPAAEMLVVPAPSAVSLACARLGWPVQDVAVASFCGRSLDTLRALLQPGRRLLVLSAGSATPSALAMRLRALGFGSSRLRLLEALGGPGEQIRPLAAEDMPVAINPLNMVAIEAIADPGARCLPLTPGLPEDWFEHDGQVSKRDIRALTLAALAPLAGDVLWDLGAGSGAIGVEWMLRHTGNRAWAVERQPDRAARIARNAVLFGVPDLQVIRDDISAALSRLPPPQAVFIGGGLTDATMQHAWDALPPGGRLVANAVTIETEARLFARHAAWGGRLTRIGIERLERIGGAHTFRPALPVTQYAGIKP